MTERRCLYSDAIFYVMLIVNGPKTSKELLNGLVKVSEGKRTPRTIIINKNNVELNWRKKTREENIKIIKNVVKQVLVSLMLCVFMY